MSYIRFAINQFFKKASANLFVQKGILILMLFLCPVMKVKRIFFIFFLFLFTINYAQTSRDSILIVQTQKELNQAILENNNSKKIDALYKLGFYAKDDSNLKALEYFNNAITLLNGDEHVVLKDINYERSLIYTMFSEFPKALEIGLKSLEFNKLNSNEKNVLRDMSHIGYLNDRMYEFSASIKWNRDALQIAKKIEDKSGEALCYGRIGIAFDELAENDNFNPKLFDSALFYNKKAAEISKNLNDLAFLRTTYSNIGNTYSKLKDYKKAEEYTLKSLAVPGFEDRKGVTLVNLGKIYLETERYEDAKKILDSAMQNTMYHGTRKYQLEAFYRLHELDVKKGDYKNALENYIEYKGIEDALLNETKTKQIAEVSERYNSAEKERQILIQRAEIAEQDLIIQERNFQIYGLLGLGLILGVIGYLFFNQQKLKNRQLQKENELKDALVKIETQNRLQEQRLRISRDLHDNIGAQLTFIISSIDNLKYGFDIKDQKLNTKLHKISEFTSETIYELRDTIWAMNKNEITFEDLQSRISNYIDKAHLYDEKITFSFNVDSSVNQQKTLSSIVGMNIHRIIQEAIHNSLKYASANEIKVNIEQLTEQLKITISDNGKGFDVNTVEKGSGLTNMKKRAINIGGDFTIISVVNKGSQVMLKV